MKQQQQKMPLNLKLKENWKQHFFLLQGKLTKLKPITYFNAKKSKLCIRKIEWLSVYKDTEYSVEKIILQLNVKFGNEIKVYNLSRAICKVYILNYNLLNF